MTAASRPVRTASRNASHYDAGEIAALVSLIVTVSAWNAIGVSTRTWQPGSYRP